MGRHLGIDRNKRICQLCQSGSIGDEFHYLFVCAKFEKQRTEKSFHFVANVTCHWSKMTAIFKNGSFI